ncbi:DUF485 domain-containing protein [Solimonas sp. K1W22B-7]|uniref:DUF485 domain-containing protein n=1 Tax=Solimonas sp. K1W22B-7 TaxID=2303331 RepID=UPI000E336545|nr:DUF485 domain-containing protein [Solimonas sp. K1W22B-7]AXQ30931.1 DUF485 domain-containing protein [Solimonas sp. K1W22B-7]
MPTELLERISRDPHYLELTRKRSRLAWVLTAIMLAVYYGFILLVAFAPDLLKQRIGDGATTLGFPLGIGVILTAILLTGIYVWKANGEYDRLTARIHQGNAS